jgi:hypothetical protein
MTVAEFIARLSEFPADMPVTFTAEGGFVMADDVEMEVAPYDEESDIPTLFINVD